MNKYDRVTGLFTDHWVTAVALFVVVLVIAIPQLRDGVVLLWKWGKRLFKKLEKPLPSAPIVLDAMGERVTFTELLRSATHDAVIVHAHTHPLGVAAEHEWIRRRYPKSRVLGQALTTLQMMAGESEYDNAQVHFDVITIQTEQGQEKEICFDISDFFGGEGSTTMNPQQFLGKKLLGIYRDRRANKALNNTGDPRDGSPAH